MQLGVEPTSGSWMWVRYYWHESKRINCLQSLIASDTLMLRLRYGSGEVRLKQSGSQKKFRQSTQNINHNTDYSVLKLLSRLPNRENYQIYE